MQQCTYYAYVDNGHKLNGQVLLSATSTVVFGAMTVANMSKMMSDIGSLKSAMTDPLGCFVAGTLVATPEGTVCIEDIKEGDYVYSENPETGEKRVVKTFVKEKHINMIYQKKRLTIAFFIRNS